jgi:hypothetical protein
MSGKSQQAVKLQRQILSQDQCLQLHHARSASQQAREGGR